MKHSGLLPTAHRFQDLAAPTLGGEVDLLTDVPALRNQMQDLTTPAHRPGQEVSIIMVDTGKRKKQDFVGKCNQVGKSFAALYFVII